MGAHWDPCRPHWDPIGNHFDPREPVGPHGDPTGGGMGIHRCFTRIARMLYPEPYPLYPEPFTEPPPMEWIPGVEI